MSNSVLQTDANGVPFYILTADPDHPGYVAIAHNPAAQTPPPFLDKCTHPPCSAFIENPAYPSPPSIYFGQPWVYLVLIAGVLALGWTGVRLTQGIFRLIMLAR